MKNKLAGMWKINDEVRNLGWISLTSAHISVRYWNEKLPNAPN